jgi:negative regulator of flagellin synthesis FlgM
MRIEAYNQIGQIYAPKKTYGTQKTNTASKMDQVHISSIGKDIQTVKQAVANTPDVREDKIASVKPRIQNGTYEVSSDDFAGKLLAAYGM